MWNPFAPFQRVNDREAERQRANALAFAEAEPTVDYPRWYLHRWHLLPEGYLSRRSIYRYERDVRRVYNLGVESRMLRRVSARLQRRGAPRVLEIGCGPGRAVAALARHVPGARTAGVDLSPFMVAAAKARVGAGADLRHADATALPWPDRSFDAVVAIHTLGHVPSEVAEAMLGEARRVLRPDGKVLLVDHAWHAIALRGWMIEHRESLALGTIRLLALRPTPA